MVVLLDFGDWEKAGNTKDSESSSTKKNLILISLPSKLK
jgi:hypothetical protein